MRLSSGLPQLDRHLARPRGESIHMDTFSPAGRGWWDGAIRVVPASHIGHAGTTGLRMALTPFSRTSAQPALDLLG